MLRIGTNRYRIVEVNSAITVTLYPPGESVFGRQQVWELETHFVPEKENYTPRPDHELEYLQLWMRAENYQVKDWRNLSDFGMNSENDSMIFTSLVNRLVGRYEPEHLPIELDDVSLRRVTHPEDSASEFLFDFRMTGIRSMPGDTELEMEVNTNVAFKEAVVYVPLNASNPISVAKVMAGKILKIDKFAGSHVTPYDPNRPTSLLSHINSHHVVTLEMPWSSSTS